MFIIYTITYDCVYLISRKFTNYLDWQFNKIVEVKYENGYLS